MLHSYSTEQLAALAHVKPTTPRVSLCRRGHWMGIKPVKLPNGRLLWPADQVHKLLQIAPVQEG